jgi:hypothetical protein
LNMMDHISLARYPPNDFEKPAPIRRIVLLAW